MSFLREVDDINQRRRDRAVVTVARRRCSATPSRASGSPCWAPPSSPTATTSATRPRSGLAGQLHLRGADVAVYDPKAAETARRTFPTLEYVDSALDAAHDADLVLHLTEWREFRELDIDAVTAAVRRPVLLDGRNVLDLQAWRAAGWTARGLGRR